MIEGRRLVPFGEGYNWIEVLVILKTTKSLLLSRAVALAPAVEGRHSFFAGRV